MVRMRVSAAISCGRRPWHSPAASRSGPSRRAAQQAPPSRRQQPADQTQLTFRAGINFVTVDAYVSDSKGQPATDLKQSDFGRPRGQQAAGRSRPSASSKSTAIPSRVSRPRRRFATGMTRSAKRRATTRGCSSFSWTTITRGWAARLPCVSR